MESFGEYLKNERELKALSLKDISKATKIRMKFLEAIERDDLEKLPADIFIQGFLRAYAQHVGVNHEEVIQRYKIHLDSLKGNDGEEREEPSLQKTKYPMFLMVVFPLFIIISIGIIYFIFDGKKKEQRENPPAAEILKSLETLPQKSAPLLSSLPIDIIETGGGDETDEETTDESAFQSNEEALLLENGEAVISSSEGEEKTLLIQALEISWLKIQVDKNSSFEVTLKPGESYEIKEFLSVKVRIGNAGGTRLFYNGKPVGLPGESGQVVSLTLPETVN